MARWSDDGTRSTQLMDDALPIELEKNKTEFNPFPPPSQLLISTCQACGPGANSCTVESSMRSNNNDDNNSGTGQQFALLFVGLQAQSEIYHSCESGEKWPLT